MESKCQNNGFFTGANHNFSDIFDSIPPAASEVEIVMDARDMDTDYNPESTDIINSLTKQVYVGSYCEKCGLKIKRSDFDNQEER